MEIRNNTPSFGMALRKPEDIGKFSKYVANASPEWIAKRGVARIAKRQANNTHFDLEYRPGKGVAVIPTSEEAKLRYGEEIFGKASKHSDLRSQVVQEYFSEAYDSAYEAASGPQRALMRTKKVLASARLFLHTITHPETFLPKSLKAASEAATQRESDVCASVAKEAKELAKKQKFESEIESIFIPKKK